MGPWISTMLPLPVVLIREVLLDSIKQVGMYRDMLVDIAKLPDQAATVREGLLKSAKAYVDEIGQATKALGKPADALPADPGVVLDRFVAAMDSATKSARQTSTQLDQLARSGYAKYARGWQTPRFGSLTRPRRSLARSPASIALPRSRSRRVYGLPSRQPRRTGRHPLWRRRAVETWRESLRSLPTASTFPIPRERNSRSIRTIKRLQARPSPST